jgi:hypothetical protein
MTYSSNIRPNIRIRQIKKRAYPYPYSPQILYIRIRYPGEYSSNIRCIRLSVPIPSVRAELELVKFDSDEKKGMKFG